MSRVVRDHRVLRAPVGRLGFCAAFLAGLGACSSGPVGSIAPGQDAVSTRLGNLLAFNSSGAPGSAPAIATGPRIDCPIVQVEPGASAFRAAAGDSSASVRYQISIGDVARECARQGDSLLVRVGVETTTVLGPAGSAGSYSAPLRVTIRRQSDEAVLASKTYRVGGAVGASAPTVSTLVADPLAVPYTTEHAADDYEVVLGFGEGPAAPRRRGQR